MLRAVGKLRSALPKGRNQEKSGWPGGLSPARLHPARVPALQHGEAATTRGHPCSQGALRAPARYIQTPRQLRAEETNNNGGGRSGAGDRTWARRGTHRGAAAASSSRSPSRHGKPGRGRAGQAPPTPYEPGGTRGRLRALRGSEPGCRSPAGLPRGRPYLGAWRQRCPSE